MKIFRLQNEKISKNILMITRLCLFFALIYRGWLLAEMQFYTLGGMLQGSFGRVVVYLTTGLISYLFFHLSASFSFNSLFRSKYSPIDENNVMMFSRNGYLIVFNIVAICTSILVGSLNFIAFYVHASTTLIIILLPVLAGIVNLIIFLLLMAIHVGKNRLRELFVSMSIPSIIMLILMR